MKRSSDSRLQGRHGRRASPPDKDICRGRAAPGMLAFRITSWCGGPCGRSALPGSSPVPHPRRCADGGLILTATHDTGVGQPIRSAKTLAPGEGRFLREALRPGMGVVDVDANMAVLPRRDKEMTDDQTWRSAWHDDRLMLGATLASRPCDVLAPGGSHLQAPCAEIFEQSAEEGR